jgi:hypothetical protein
VLRLLSRCERLALLAPLVYATLRLPQRANVRPVPTAVYCFEDDLRMPQLRRPLFKPNAETKMPN